MVLKIIHFIIFKLEFNLLLLLLLLLYVNSLLSIFNFSPCIVFQLYFYLPTYAQFSKIQCKTSNG